MSWRKKIKNYNWKEKENFLFFNPASISYYYNDITFHPVKRRTKNIKQGIETCRIKSRKSWLYWKNLSFEERVQTCLNIKKGKQKRSLRIERSCGWISFLHHHGVIKSDFKGKKKGKDIRSMLIQVEHIRKPTYTGVIQKKDFNLVW